MNKAGYCDKHKSSEPIRGKLYDTITRRNNPLLADAADFRSSYKWQQVRKQKLAINPLCEDPFKEHERRQVTETAKQVHHIVGLAQCANDERAYSLDNLMSLCWKCHRKIEVEEIKRLQEL